MRYNLICAKDHEFEAWFPSSVAYDEQRQKGQVRCPDCGTRRVEKALMAPSVSTARKHSSALKQEMVKNARKALVKLRKEVEKNSEYVGENFAHEARKIHYGDAEDRSIYGEATIDDAKELVEEGIEVSAIPWVETQEN